MITKDLIKKRFVHEVMTKGLNTIYATQSAAVEKYLNKRSGELSSYLSRAPFTNQSGEGRTVYYLPLFSYLRFLDIGYRRSKDRISKHIRSNLALYNRVVWGVLYHETFPELEYGFTKEIHDRIKKELEDALLPEQSNNL